MSDERLQLTVLDFCQLTNLEGRILVHGEEESSGRRYLMLEGTDAQIHYVYYTPEMEVARNSSGLQTNSFVRFRKLLDGRPRLEIEELGDAESMLHNKLHLRDTAQRLIQRGIILKMTVGRGWLGRYQQALEETATTLESQRVMREAGRKKRRNLGR